jgi:hypothetical protein
MANECDLILVGQAFLLLREHQASNPAGVGKFICMMPTLALRVLLNGFFVGKEENFREVGRDQVWNQGKKWIECDGKHAKNY